jgi:putative endonuclease
MENIAKGRRAEAAAREYLRHHGYQIIAERYRWGGGEIDLIARDGDCLVFIEVKSRTSRAYGLPEEAVTPDKQRKLIQTAQHYLLKHPTDLETRFDVVALSSGGLRLYQDAFSVD